ncbi:MAG: COX15/CtaA family protein [Phycisphaerales bacterium]
MLPLFLTTLLWIKGIAPQQRLTVGALAGLIAGTINLLILGSDIVVQPDSTDQMTEQANTLAPDAWMVIAGSLLLSIAVGLIAATIAGKKESGSIRSARVWRSRFGWVTAMTYLPLIAVGGAVTSTDSGLAVPDAVTTYGAVSVLFPLKLMSEPRIFLEHSHRLFGTLAGLTTLVLMIRVLIGEPRKLLKVLGITLFCAVTLQGIMGILRVADQSTIFAIIHGIFAQFVFAGALGLAIMLSERWQDAQPSDAVVAAARKASTLIGLMFVAAVIQLILGAITRHLNSGHAMIAHMGFAVVTMLMVILGGAMCMRVGKTDPSGSAIRPFGAILHGLVTIQFTLGFGVLGMGWSSQETSPLPTPDTLATADPVATPLALIATAHHITGALVLAMTFGACVWMVRLAKSPKIG